jgi:hypothetical protein
MFVFTFRKSARAWYQARGHLPECQSHIVSFSTEHKIQIRVTMILSEIQ